jgi:CHAD domain-containing protein
MTLHAASSPLGPETPAVEAVADVLRVQFETLLEQAAELRAPAGAGPLHDFRVALRRTRTALSRFKSVFPPALADHFQTEFAWLGEQTGSLRDLDVLLLELPRFAEFLPAKMRPDLEPLCLYLEACRGREQERLSTQFDTERYAALVQDWSRFLRNPRPSNPAGIDAGRPILEVSSKRIRKLDRQVRKRGLGLDANSRPAEFHRLRIKAKQLRYLMEFFRDLYEPSCIDRLIRTVKQIQSGLGRMNDLSVQRRELKRLADHLNRERLVRLATVVAMLRLVRELRSRRIQEYEQFQESFRGFTKPKLRAQAKSLFKA